jgi:transposase
MATRERRKFTPEFKREAVKLAEQPGRSLSAVARELGVARTALKLWVDNFAAGRYEKDRTLPLKAAQQQEMERLRRELAKVRMERDIPKKSAGASSRKSRREVCLCRPLSAGVADPGHVSAAGGVGEQILRVVGSAAKRAVAGERTPIGAHSGKLRVERADLRLAADLEGQGRGG